MTTTRKGPSNGRSGNGNGGILPKMLVNAIAILVSLVWAVSFVADILIVEYDPSPFIHLAMMAIVGGIFGRQFIRNGG